MTISQSVDTIIVLISVDDPLTRDKGFIQSIKYSPFVAGGTEMSASSRKAIRSQRGNLEPLYVDKFVVEVFVDKFGEFIAHFLPNKSDQRSLIYREYRVDRIPDNQIPQSAREYAKENDMDVEELLEDEAEVTQIYELISGPPLKEDGTAEVDDEDEDDNDVTVIAASKMKPVPHVDDQDDDMDDCIDRASMSEDVFVAPSTKIIH